MTDLTDQQRLRNDLYELIATMHGYTPQVMGELIRDWLIERNIPAEGVIYLVRDEYDGLPPKSWNLADTIIDRVMS